MRIRKPKPRKKLKVTMWGVIDERSENEGSPYIGQLYKTRKKLLEAWDYYGKPKFYSETRVAKLRIEEF